MVLKNHKIAIIIPCFNEATTIAKVVKDFREAVPQADIYVIDNNSTDGTGDVARGVGVEVLREPMQGKGYALRRAFEEIDADLYIMVDGDDTYPAEDVYRLLEPIITHSADMVVGTRLSMFDDGSFRSFHKFGNVVISFLINMLFNVRLTDVLSGYRAFSRKFVKSVPLTSKGFEVETELTLLAADGDFTIVEIPIHYRKRPSGSSSKLNTWKDGMLILFTILNILRDYRPLAFFFSSAFCFLTAGLFVGVPVIVEFMRTGYITKVPSAILAAALELLAFQMVGVGLTLDTIARMRRMQLFLWRKYGGR